MSKKRFEVVYEENTNSAVVSTITVIVDKQTGVQYLCSGGIVLNTGGMTPLLDKDGKPVIADLGY
jgi:hypothetical protein